MSNAINRAEVRPIYRLEERYLEQNEIDALSYPTDMYIDVVYTATNIDSLELMYSHHYSSYDLDADDSLIEPYLFVSFYSLSDTEGNKWLERGYCPATSIDALEKTPKLRYAIESNKPYCIEG